MISRIRASLRSIRRKDQASSSHHYDAAAASLSERPEPISFGRNINAGYIRGVGVQSGNLIPAIRAERDYAAALAASRGRSVVNEHCLLNLFLIIKYGSWTGSIIEFGSYNGGSALFLAELAKRLRPGVKVFALDTFEGMPPTNASLDHHAAGDFKDAAYDDMIRLRDESGLTNLVVLKGLFQDTVVHIPAADCRIGLAHIDCDIYESVAFSTRWAKLHAATGAYFVFDDPLYSTCIGAMQAVEEELVQAEKVFAEQVYPHFVYRFPPIP
jgi:hypothetical protein